MPFSPRAGMRSVSVAIACFGLLIPGCTRIPTASAESKAGTVRQEAPLASTGTRIVRATGTVQAVRSYTVRVPQLSQVVDRSSQLTLTKLVLSGTPVKQGDTLVEFDSTAQLDQARDAQAKLDDLQHQLSEKRAQVDSDSTKRISEIKQAEAELGKAEIQLEKGPVLADIERKKNEAKAAGARERLASLKKAHEYRLKAESAAVKVVELKCERQKVVVDRLKANLERLSVKAPHDGMVALENVWRSGSMGPPQVGDQMWPNQPVLRIFDPSEMIVDAQVNEPDFAVLGSMSRAKVFLDAYPNTAFDAELRDASPVATAGLESPVKSFTARFRISQHDPRVLPDLSASLEIELGRAAGSPPAAKAAATTAGGSL